MESHLRTPAQAYDERPAKGGGNYEDGAPNGADVPSIARRLNPDSPDGAPAPSHQLPDGFPPDLPAPEPFSAAGLSLQHPTELFRMSRRSCCLGDSQSLFCLLQAKLLVAVSPTDATSLPACYAYHFGKLS